MNQYSEGGATKIFYGMFGSISTHGKTTSNVPDPYIDFAEAGRTKIELNISYVD